MNLLISRNGKQLENGEKLVQQPSEAPKKCSNLKIAAVIAAWASLIIASLGFAEVIYFVFFYDSGYSQPATIDNVIRICVYIITQSVFFGITYLNVYGVHKDKLKYMRPWLIYAASATVFFIFRLMVCMPTLRIIVRPWESEEMTKTIILVVCFIIIYNHYCNLKNGPYSQKHMSLLKVGAIASAWFAILNPFCYLISVGDFLVEKTLNDIFVYYCFTFSSIEVLLLEVILLTVILGLSIANIYGIHKDNLKYIKPWLICDAAAVPLLMISLIILTITSGELFSENNVLLVFIIVVHSLCLVFEYKHFRKIEKTLEGKCATTV